MDKPSKAQQIFLYIAPFPAMAFFKIWASMGRAPQSILLAAVAMVAYFAVIIILAFRWDKPTYFDWACGAYFTLAALLLFFVPEQAGSFYTNYGITGIYLTLFTAAFLPPLLGLEPFTYHYARKSAPSGVWESVIFIRINQIMTYVWAGLFAVCVLVSIYPSVITRAFIPLSLLLGFGLPFSRLYPDFHLKRLGLPPLSEQREVQSEIQGTASPASLSGYRFTCAREAVSGMPLLFNAAAQDLQALIAFQVTGSEEFVRYLLIEDNTCTLLETTSRTPDLLITTPAHVWLKISNGEISGRDAFLNNEYKAKGNLGILMRMGELFKTRT